MIFLFNKNIFKESCTVLNGTLAWDLEGNYDETKCLDIDPFNIYENSLEVEENESILFNIVALDIINVS